MRTLQDIEKAIETLPQLIGRDVEDLDRQRLALESFFQDDETDHE